jgi:hypothetical protein
MVFMPEPIRQDILVDRNISAVIAYVLSSVPYDTVDTALHDLYTSGRQRIHDGPYCT